MDSEKILTDAIELLHHRFHDNTEEYLTQLARNAYNSYGGVTDHKNYQGLPMPLYNDLPPKIQNAWREAVKRVKEDIGNY